MQFSVAVRNGRLDSLETTIGASPTLEWRSGDLPANCAAADNGTLLGDAELPSDWLAAASAGSKALAGSWDGEGASGAGAGTHAQHYRIKDSGSTCHIQGLCAQAWAGSTAYVVGQQVANNGLVYRCATAGTTASSGGPTGTGSGISDGTATWNYLGPASMIMDNTNIANGQSVSVESFTITDGNA